MVDVARTRPSSDGPKSSMWRLMTPSIPAGASGLLTFSSLSVVALLAVMASSNVKLRAKTDYAEEQQKLAQRNERRANAQTKIARQQMLLAQERGLSDRRRAYAGSMVHGFDAWWVQRLDRVLARLELERPKDDQPDVRGFEWYLSLIHI